MLFLSPQHCILSVETTFLGADLVPGATAVIPELLTEWLALRPVCPAAERGCAQDEGQDLAEQLKAESQHE